MEQEVHNYSVDIGAYRYIVVVVRTPKGRIVKTYAYNRELGGKENDLVK